MHECDFYTHKSEYYTQSAISTCRVWFYTLSMISTHTSVILTRISVNMTLTWMITTRSSVIYTRRVGFPHAECDFYTHNVTYTRNMISTGDYNRHENDFYLHSTIFTRKVWFYTQSVVSTHTRVIWHVLLLFIVCV
jgi:hypothetical protein